MEQDRKDRAREPGRAGAAAEAVAGPAPEVAGVVVATGVPAGVPDSRARAGDRVRIGDRESAEGEEIPTRAGEQDADGDSAEAPADA